MFLLFGLFFQVIPPGKYQNTSSKKIIKIDYDKGSYCKPQSVNTGSYTDGKNNAHYYCDTNTDQFVFKNCYFHDITMNGNRYSYFILSYHCDLTIEDSTFTEIQVYGRLISAEQDDDNDYTFAFKSNQIYHLRFYEKKRLEPTLLTQHRHCVYSEFKNTIITNNNIELDNSLAYKARGTGFHLKYHSGCIFKGNTLKNCVNEDEYEAGGLYFDEKGSKDTLQLSDCTFTNCIGNDPSIMYIKDIDLQLTITGVTFEQSENLKEHCIIKITPSNENCDLIFDGCKFTNLKCNGKSCGGIGLWFVKEGSESSQILEFKGTTFEHLIYSHKSFGGGAISLTKEERNKKTKLIIDDCIFSDVYSEKGNGGAIYYYPDDNTDSCSITITKCTFKQIYSKANDGCGQAIFIGNTKSNSNSIKYCTFNDCCNEITEKYVLYFDVNYIDFSNNLVTFSDTSKNNGCIFSSRVEEHIYRNNIFKNARADGDLSAGIHERNPSSTSRFTVINNTFENILGSSQGRCFMIDLKKTYEQNIQNNTIKNCPAGGALFQIRFINVDVQSFTIESFNFISNSVNDALYNTYQSAPQVLVLEYSESAQFYDRNMIIFSNCYFEKNYNPYTGGAISYGNSRFTAYTTVRFYKCTFVENHAKNGGGAISIQLYDGCMIEECNFVNNIADEQRSSAIYIQTVFKCKNNGNDIDMPGDVNPTVQILKCTFNGNNEGKSSCILIDSSSNAPILINETNFINTKVPNNVIEIPSNVKSFVSFGNRIEFTDSNGCGGIFINSNGKTIISDTKFIQTSKNSALTITSSSDSDSVSVKNCIFDSCLANGYSCFSFSTKTNSLIFESNVIQKITAKGCKNYVGLFDGNGKLQKLTMKNVTFLDNIQSSLYGGGTGLMFNGIAELSFEKCNFTNNCAIENRSEKRQSQYSEHPYYNGDGGAIQIGHLCQTNNMKVSFSQCEFNNNKAQRNGGAIAIQTLNEVLMEYCKFNNNIANYDFSSLSSSTLLFDDHFYKKQNGRGGALYINPSYNHNCQTTNDYMTSVKLDNNDFNLNKAFDGYAMYIEGDDGTNTIFDFHDNSFNDNFNESNYNEKNPDALYGAVIVTEIFTITEKSLNDNYNHFEYKLTTKKVNMISHVDHYANTPTNEFTASDFFPSNNFTYSNMFSQSHLFSNSNPFNPSDSFTKSVQFSQSNLFTKTTQFSQSDFFSKSTEFDPTNFFSKSSEFNPSECFSKSAPFSQSNTIWMHNTIIPTNEEVKTTTISTEENKYTETPTVIITEENKDTETPTITITEESKDTETPTITITEENKDTETPTITITEESKDTETPTITITEDNKDTETPTVIITEDNKDTETPTITITEDNKDTEIPSIIITKENKISESQTVVITEDNNINRTQVVINPSKQITTSDNEQNPTQIIYSSFLSTTLSNKEKDDGTGSSNSTKSSKNIKISLIIGIVIGLVVLIVIILLIIIFVIRKKRERNSADENADQEMNIESAMSSNTVSTNNSIDEFENPLYQEAQINGDPFDQVFDEDSIV